jgi:hypothetical protein
VPSSSSSSSSPTAASQLVPTTSSIYEDTVVARLHLQAAVVVNVRQLVSIVLDSSPTNYASWRDLMEQARQRYVLIKHIMDDTLSNDPGWIQMDSVILNWISNSISADLHQVVREHGCTARHLWLTIENQFLGSREQRTLHLDVVFRTFVQGLLLRRSSSFDLVVYTYADWAGCPDTHRSTSGYAVFLRDNLVSWLTKRQTIVSRSSAEAEYRAVANGVAEATWLRQLLHELQTPPSRCTLVYCGNISAAYLSTNPVQHQRTKHVEIDFHFI